MNGTTATLAKWYVRVIDPKVVQYSFTARSEKVGAEKFQCVLVSNAPEQYMLGVVPLHLQRQKRREERHGAVHGGLRLAAHGPGL